MCVCSWFVVRRCVRKVEVSWLGAPPERVVPLWVVSG
jgi:hypothetical protein